jgi:hypothetical protein
MPHREHTVASDAREASPALTNCKLVYSSPAWIVGRPVDISAMGIRTRGLDIGLKAKRQIADVNTKMMTAIPPEEIGRMMSGVEAAELIFQLVQGRGRPRP